MKTSPRSLNKSTPPTANSIEETISSGCFFLKEAAQGAYLSPIMEITDATAQPPVLTPAEISIEKDLLSLGVVSLDGLNGLNHAQALAVAKYSVPIAQDHYQRALSAGLI